VEIRDLKMNNAHFSRLFKNYHELDHEVIRIEEGVENTSDEYLDKLKKPLTCIKALNCAFKIYKKPEINSGILIMNFYIYR